MTISLCLIVKNEEKTLARCLDSVKDIVDEIIIVDTGSTDKTKQIALTYTKNLYHFKWIDDFSAARNFAFSKATKDYLMWLDADDVLLEPDRVKFKQLLKNFDNSFDVVMMKYQMSVNTPDTPACTFMRERLLKREKGFTWHDPIHEYIILDGKILNSDITITHKKMHEKSNRNLLIFEKLIKSGKELSHRNKFYYARELYLNSRFEEAIPYYNQFLDTPGGMSSNYMDASMDLASCYKLVNNEKNILKALLRSFEHFSPRAEICCQIGFYFKQKKDYTNAIFWYDLASKIEKPQNSWGSIIEDYYDFIPNMELSSCYFHLNNLDLAIHYNTVAKECKPDNQLTKQNTEYFNTLKGVVKNMEHARVLVGSPVYQKPAILKYFLESLKKLTQDSINLDFIFVDDNVQEDSTKLLLEFKKELSSTIILEGKKQADYECDDSTTHKWTSNNVLKVIEYKNKIINHAIEKNYDYLFLIDSDIVIHPYLIEHLKSKDKDIVSEIFWTQFQKGSSFLPNVWMLDQYDLCPREFSEVLTTEEKILRTDKFLQQLKSPGVYKVGGLGACTLIKREALVKGVNFTPISNLTISGEDRYFCIRATVLDIELFVDTHYPAYHIYRDELLEGVENYTKTHQLPIRFIRKYKTNGNKLTLSMVVKNEGSRYLKEMLTKLKGVIDEAVIIDDASTDNTVEICNNILKDIPTRIIKNENSMFSNEIVLRNKQWEETLKTNPDWILNLDADEIFEDSFYSNIKNVINTNHNFDVLLFHLYDMWDQNHYREDKYWNAHNHFKPFLLRYQPDFLYEWCKTPQHCGRFPANILSLPKGTSHYRLKHYGWAKLEDRKNKYERYKLLDPDAIYGNKEQYESILDENPTLVEWQE